MIEMVMLQEKNKDGTDGFDQNILKDSELTIIQILSWITPWG
jgi:hypothetical protein